MSDSVAAQPGPVCYSGTGALLDSQTVPATIRSLPDGESRTATLLAVDGRALRIEAPGPPLVAGSLLEIESGNALYLGEVERGSGTAYRIAVEHFVDRAALAAVREIWS
jgi:hypothetical protein